MSRTTRSTKTFISNPVARTFQWSAGGKNGGNFKYWDGEKECVTSNLSFVPVGLASSIGGWNKKTKSKIYSNLIINNQQDFIVRTGSGTEKTVLAEGKYQDFKGFPFVYITNIFALVKIEEGWKLACIQLKKSDLAAWKDFSDTVDIYDHIITVDSFEDREEGDTEYKVPIFTSTSITPELSEVADDADKQLLQPFLTQWLVPTNDEA